jgi:hypothetical protein
MSELALLLRRPVHHWDVHGPHCRRAFGPKVLARIQLAHPALLRWRELSAHWLRVVVFVRHHSTVRSPLEPPRAQERQPQQV